MTEKPDNTEEAVAWRAKNYQGEPWTVAPCEFSKRHYQRIEPLFPLSSLETRDARIAELEGEVVRHARDMMVYREAHDQKAVRLAEAVGALEPFAAFGGKLADYEQFSGKSTTTQWAEHFRRARQALSSIKGEG